MGAACASNGQDFHAARRTLRDQARIPVWLDGQPTLIPRDVRVGQLLSSLPRSRRPLVALEMADAQLRAQRTLWQEGVRQGAYLNSVRPPLAAAMCPHVALQVGSACADGYRLVCPDCEQSAVVVLAVQRTKVVELEPHSPAWEQLERRWMADRSAEAMRDCRHPIVAKRLVMIDHGGGRGYYEWKIECAKCRASADETRRAIDRLKRTWRAAHADQENHG